MSTFLQQLKDNTITINSGSKSFETSHFNALLFMFFLSGLSSLLGYVLLGMFGNGIMFLVAFIAPVILYYIYTLSEDIVNPLFTKIGFTQINLDFEAKSSTDKIKPAVSPTNTDEVAAKN